MPYDFTDPLSCEFASINLGNAGRRTEYSADLIEQKLPSSWGVEVHESGNHRYHPCVDDVYYTVHPARFFNQDDENNGLVRLPPGWDRRLDKWGNLFFVDHNTKSASRNDPRFNRLVDQEIGLPLGWKKIANQKGRAFFYSVKSKIVEVTYEPSSMNSKSLSKKHFLTRVPIDGDHPADLIRRRKTSRGSNEAPIVGSVQQIKFVVPDRIAKPKQEETALYFQLFLKATPRKTFRLNKEEAIAQCRDFGLPENIIIAVLESSDADRNELWNADEYADTVHKMRFFLDTQMKEHGNKPITVVEIDAYTQVYEAYIPPGQAKMTIENVHLVSKDWNLPQDVIDEIWGNSDANKDGEWNVDEFVNGYHWGMQEINYRKGRSHIRDEVLRRPSTLIAK